MKEEIEKGALVKILKRSSWGGVSWSGQVGVVVKRKYLAYEKSQNLWHVFVRGVTRSHREDLLKVVD